MHRATVGVKRARVAMINDRPHGPHAKNALLLYGFHDLGVICEAKCYGCLEGRAHVLARLRQLVQKRWVLLYMCLDLWSPQSPADERWAGIGRSSDAQGYVPMASLYAPLISRDQHKFCSHEVQSWECLKGGAAQEELQLPAQIALCEQLQCQWVSALLVSVLIKLKQAFCKNSTAYRGVWMTERRRSIRQHLPTTKLELKERDQPPFRGVEILREELLVGPIQTNGSSDGMAVGYIQ